MALGFYFYQSFQQNTTFINNEIISSMQILPLSSCSNWLYNFLFTNFQSSISITIFVFVEVPTQKFF